MATKTLNSQLEYIYGLERFGIKLGLEVMEELLGALAQPQRAYKTIHITGTNGKGSTASFLASVLEEAGLKTGLYTSPHLHVFNERVRVNGEPISDERLITLIAQVREKIASKKLTATFFEFTTALAFLYFSQERVDIAVIEVGMGGLLDATNVITPEVAIITNIGLDHVPMIGHTKLDIARNKAGIIKPGVSVVTAERDPEIIRYFVEVCEARNAHLYSVQQSLTATVLKSSLDEQTFAISARSQHRVINTRCLTPGVEDGEFAITMLGQHQIENACTALMALHVIAERGIHVPTDVIQRGLQKTTWEGRLEVVSENPFILVDGAHNDDGVHRLRSFLDEAKLPFPSVLVLAMKRDKDARHMVSEIATLFDHIVVTEGSYEPMPAEELATSIRSVNQNVYAVPKVSDAVATASKLQAPGGMMLITGSLYMIGGALEVIKEKVGEPSKLATS